MFEGLFQPMHLLVIFAIVMLVVGPKKLPELGKGLGESIRGFRAALKSGDTTSSMGPTTPKALLEARTSSDEPLTRAD